MQLMSNDIFMKHIYMDGVPYMVSQLPKAYLFGIIIFTVFIVVLLIFCVVGIILGQRKSKENNKDIAEYNQNKENFSLEEDEKQNENDYQ